MDLLAAVVAVLLMRVGFALYAAGLVRAKNSASTVFRVISDLCVAVLAFWLIGGAILFQQHNRWFGFDVQSFGWNVKADPEAARLLVYLVLILTVTPVVAGAVAERGRFFMTCAASASLAAIVLPATCFVAWSGWLRSHGFVDLGGASCLHAAAGVFAAVAVAFVGPRTGKFNRDGSSSMIPGHNLPLAAIGLILSWIGWVAYLGLAALLRTDTKGDFGLISHVASTAAVNVLLAGAAAGFASIIYAQFRYGKPDLMLTLTGVLGGLLSVCAGAWRMPIWSAVVCGCVAGVIIPVAVSVIDMRGRLDDPLGIIAIHAIGGAWGTIAAGFFVRLAPGVTAVSRIQQLLMQLIGLAGICIFSALIAIALFATLKFTVGLAVKEGDEFDGLDLAQHDIGAYPDFQQTTIKSYHLREA